MDEDATVSSLTSTTINDTQLSSTDNITTISNTTLRTTSLLETTTTSTQATTTSSTTSSTSSLLSSSASSVVAAAPAAQISILVYVILGIVCAVLIIVVIHVIYMCLWKCRQKQGGDRPPVTAPAITPCRTEAMSMNDQTQPTEPNKDSPKPPKSPPSSPKSEEKATPHYEYQSSTTPSVMATAVDDNDEDHYDDVGALPEVKSVFQPPPSKAAERADTPPATDHTANMRNGAEQSTVKHEPVAEPHISKLLSANKANRKSESKTKSKSKSNKAVCQTGMVRIDMDERTLTESQSHLPPPMPTYPIVHRHGAKRSKVLAKALLSSGTPVSSEVSIIKPTAAGAAPMQLVN